MKGMRTYIRKVSLTMMSIGLSAALAACGGGGGGSTAAGGGTSAGTTGFTRGAITGFGSVHVGDKIFSTSGATVKKRLDDGPDHIPGADDSVFRVGMVVEVFHKSGDNNAVEIRFKDDLEGPVSNLAAGPPVTFDVLGVHVVTDGNTNFDDSLDDHPSTGITLATLANGNVVEVSGLFDGNGVLHATFIEAKKAAADANDKFEIKGTIAALAGTAPNQTFTVNGASFATDNNTRLHDLPAGGLANGMFVEVKTSSTTAPFLATDVEGTFEDPEIEAEDADEVSIEGYVAGLSGSDPNWSFTLAGVTVTTSAATTGHALVAPNAHIEAEGPMVGGVMQARKIGLRP